MPAPAMTAAVRTVRVEARRRAFMTRAPHSCRRAWMDAWCRSVLWSGRSALELGGVRRLLGPAVGGLGGHRVVDRVGGDVVVRDRLAPAGGRGAELDGLDE